MADAQPGEDCVLGESCNLEHELVTVQLVDGAGRGVFAQRDIESGTELWSETPLSFAPSRDALVHKVDGMLWRHASLCRKRFAATKGEGIVASNYFDQGVLGAYLFEQTSLLNHACCPNASVRFVRSETRASECRLRTVVARHLERGEQVCISYSSTALFLPTDARRQLLHDRWGFWCHCERCVGTLPAGEQERWAMLEEAAAAADALGKPRPATVDPAVVALQTRAAELVASWLPALAEGERFAEDAAYLTG